MFFMHVFNNVFTIGKKTCFNVFFIGKLMFLTSMVVGGFDIGISGMVAVTWHGRQRRTQAVEVQLCGVFGSLQLASRRSLPRTHEGRGHLSQTQGTARGGEWGTGLVNAPVQLPGWRRNGWQCWRHGRWVDFQQQSSPRSLKSQPLRHIVIHIHHWRI